MSTTEGAEAPENAARTPNYCKTRPWRTRLAGLLRTAAERLHPTPRERRSLDIHLSRVIMLPGFERLGHSAWQRGDVVVRFRATDPIWLQSGGEDRMIGLREHVRRLCVSAHELSMSPLEAGGRTSRTTWSSRIR